MKEEGRGEGREKVEARCRAKVASAGETSEYGDAGADIEESRGRYRGKGEEGGGWERGGRGVYANIFPAPTRKTEAPLLPVSLFARLPPSPPSIVYIASPLFSSFLPPFSRRFFCFLSRFSRRFFFSLLFPLSLAACVKNVKNEGENR